MSDELTPEEEKHLLALLPSPLWPELNLCCPPNAMDLIFGEPKK